MAGIDLRYYDQVTDTWIAPLANGEDLEAVKILIAKLGQDVETAVEDVELAVQTVSNVEQTVSTLHQKVTQNQEVVTEHLAEITWNDVTLLNGWEPFGVGYEPKYAIDKHKNLIIKGAIKNGVTTRNTVLFELPINARPAVFRQFLVVNNNQSFDNYQYQSLEISIAPNGKVLIGSAAPFTQLISLDEIHIQL